MVRTVANEDAGDDSAHHRATHCARLGDFPRNALSADSYDSHPSRDSPFPPVRVTVALMVRRAARAKPCILAARRWEGPGAAPTSNLFCRRKSSLAAETQPGCLRKRLH
jgi:hypothetical protein